MKYRVHRLDVSMTTGQDQLEEFLNNLDGEVEAIMPNITAGFLWIPRVNFLLIIEKVS